MASKMYVIQAIKNLRKLLSTLGLQQFVGYELTTSLTSSQS